jgi:hypothetical protein
MTVLIYTIPKSDPVWDLKPLFLCKLVYDFPNQKKISVDNNIDGTISRNNYYTIFFTIP